MSTKLVQLAMQQLAEDGLESRPVQIGNSEDDADSTLVATFSQNERVHSVFVWVTLDEEYFTVICPIRVRVKGKLEDFPARRLVDFLRASHRVKLAKLDVVEHEGTARFAAVSDCSTQPPFGKKLHRRMEACARLASLIEEIG